MIFISNIDDLPLKHEHGYLPAIYSNILDKTIVIVSGVWYEINPKQITPKDFYKRYETPKVIKIVDNSTQTFEVNSSSLKSPNKKYIVTRTGEKYKCTCIGYGYRRTCKHIENIKSKNV